ncbi:MAG: hypothetical protein IJ550_03935 [Bacteroidaceae bacterium]|nr:hypothetical protein [Bacteroidaceae bacterium]
MKKYLKYIYLFAFITVAYILLPVMNGDYLYTIQDNNVFINGHTFMMETVTGEGGWIVWVARYLTQFFYHPWLGSTILILFWVAIYWITIRMFNIKDKWCFAALAIPVFLLYDLLSYGYWIYYAKAPGFPFVPTLLVLFALLYTWGIIYLTRNLHISWHLKGLIAIGPLAIIPYISHLLWSTSWHWHLDYQPKNGILTTLTDKNFRHELRMYRALDEFRFEDVLNEMPTDGQAPTNLMVLYKNIALMHTGQMDRMFEINNCGIKPDTGDSPKIRTSLLGAPIIYYMFGHINYSFRWAMENAVQYGLSFRSLKMMTRCAIFNQEFEVAAKYISLLKSSTFHRQWAIEHEAWMMNSTNFIQSKEYQTLSPLLSDNKNILDGDDGLCEQYLLEYFSDLNHPSTPLLENVTMCMSLWAKDYYAFCVHFYDYVNNHPNSPIPLLYQEGAILLGNAEESPITLDQFRFDDIVANKYNGFIQDYNQLLQQGIKEQEMAKRLKPLYGNTYWWYYYFYNDFNIY